MSAWAVFLDRDGVLNEPVPHPESGLAESPHRAEDVRLTAGAPEALRMLRRLGAQLVVVSNQPSAAKGIAACEDLRAVHDAVAGLLEDAGTPPDDWRYCFHHPDGGDPDLGRACACRKPAPGMLLDAARERSLDLAASWLLGDGDADLLAGRAAGCRTVLVAHPATHHRRGAVAADLSAPDILAAARLLTAALSGGRMTR